MYCVDQGWSLILDSPSFVLPSPRCLLEPVSVESCLGLYELGYTLGDQDLKEEAKALVSAHFHHLSENNQSFLYLSPNTLLSLVSLDSLEVSSELIVFQAIWRWMMAQVSSRVPFLQDLLAHVRFPLLTPKELQVIQSELSRYPELRLLWKRLDWQARLQWSRGLRRGMYDNYIVCIFKTESLDLKSKDFLAACYNPQTETWRKLPLFKSLDFARCVAVGDKLYVNGGIHANYLYSDTLHEFSPLHGSWTQLPSMSVARASHGFLECNEKLYAFGGWRDYEDYLDSAECFDLVEKEWTPLAKMPFAVSHFASAVLKGKLYVIGGITDSEGSWYLSRNILIYDVSDDSWSQVLFKHECYWSGAVAANEGIYVIGGYIRSRINDLSMWWAKSKILHCSRQCFLLGENGKEIKWVSVPDLPVELAGAGVARWKNRIYVLGGENTYPIGDVEDKYYNTVFYWEPGDSKWTQCRKRLPFPSWTFRGFGCTTMNMPKKPIKDLFQQPSFALIAIEPLKA